jgi:FkbM family methyltransferase
LPRVLHDPLVWLFSGARRRIRSGPNAGRFWSVTSSGRGYVSGNFERERLAAMESLTRPGDVFWDVGAHQGYVTLAAAKWVGPQGRVVSFEPSSANRAFLERHVRWNRLDNVGVLPFAMSDTDGVAMFGGTGGSVSFRLGRGDESVATRTIRSLIENGSIPRPTVLKLDVERSEAAALRGGTDYLMPDMIVWISLHSRELYHECRGLLAGRGMTVYESAKLREVIDPKKSWGGDKELLAVGADRVLTPDEMEAVSRFKGSE